MKDAVTITRHAAQALAALIRPLIGYVENGSDGKLTVFQDDATKDYFVKIGGAEYCDQSLIAALERALEKGEYI